MNILSASSPQSLFSSDLFIGHGYMSEIKSLLKVLEPIITEPLIQGDLKFESPSAYLYFMKCSNTNKVYQPLQLLVIGIALARPRCGLIWQLVFSFGLAILRQKIEDRNIDACLHDARRCRFMEIFYGFSHPIYEDIDNRDLFNRASYPVEIANICKQNLTFTITNKKAKYQGWYIFI